MLPTETSKEGGGRVIRVAEAVAEQSAEGTREGAIVGKQHSRKRKRMLKQGWQAVGTGF